MNKEALKKKYYHQLLYIREIITDTKELEREEKKVYKQIARLMR